jgi:glycosyltransferase involved in cell wall biosynthesis
MRLCIDAGPTENSHRLRGIGACTRHLLAAMTPELAAAHGMDLVVVSRRPVARWLDRPWSRRGWTAELTGIRDDTSPRMANWSQLIDGEWTLARDVAATRADVFLATDPHAVALSMAFPTVAILYDVVPLVMPSLYLTGRMAGLPDWLYRHRLARARRATAQIAISETTRADAARLAGFDPHRMSVVPLAVDHETFRLRDPIEARAHLGLTRPYLLFVGAADPRKNLAAVLDAYAPLRAREVDEVGDVDLVVVGATGQPQDGVQWLGHVADDDLAWLYAGAMALVFPSLYEGFGLPILEAMASGTPVITLRNSAIPEVAGDAALYVDESCGLGEAMQMVIGDSGLRTRLRDAGLRRAASYSWTRTAEGVLTACRAVANSNPGWRATSRAS